MNMNEFIGEAKFILPKELPLKEIASKSKRINHLCSHSMSLVVVHK